MSSSASCSSSLPSSPPHFPARRYVTSTGEGDEGMRPRTRWSSDNGKVPRLTGENAAGGSRAATPVLPHLKMHRLSDDAVITGGSENTSPMITKGTIGFVASKGCYAGLPNLSITPAPTTHIRPPMRAAQADVPSPNASLWSGEKNAVGTETANVLDEMSYSAIGLSPPALSFTSSHDEAVAMAAMDICATVKPSNRYAQPSEEEDVDKDEKEMMWPPPPLLSTILWTSEGSADEIVRPASTTKAFTRGQQEQTPAVSHANLVPHAGAPAAATRPTRAGHHHYYSHHASSTSNNSSINTYTSLGKQKKSHSSVLTAEHSTPTAAAQPSAATTDVFGSSLPHNDNMAESSFSMLTLTELSTSASHLPQSEQPHSSLPPFNLPTLPSSPQRALPQVQHLRLNSAPEPPNLNVVHVTLSLSSSVVMSASRSPSPAAAAATAPAATAKRRKPTVHVTSSSRESTGIPTSTNVGAPLSVEEPQVLTSTSPDYQPLSPTHGGLASKAARLTTSADAASFTIKSNQLHSKCMTRTTPPCDARSALLPAPQWPSPQPLPPVPTTPTTVFDASHHPQFQPDLAVKTNEEASASSRVAAVANHHLNCPSLEVRAELQPSVPTSRVGLSGSPPAYPPPPPPLWSIATAPNSPPRVTLLAYVKDMKSPTTHSRSFTSCLILTGTCFCLLPLCFCVLLLGLHYWAVELQERSYLEPKCRGHVGSMLKTNFTLLLGVLLCVVVMGLGGGISVYALLYRQAIRYQRCAFALCAKLSYGLATKAQGRPSPSGNLDEGAAAHTAAERNTPPQRLLEEESRHKDDNVDGTTLTTSSTVFRWHREVFALLEALAAPLDTAIATAPLSTAPLHYLQRNLSSLRDQVDRPLFHATVPGAPFSGAGPRPVPFAGEYGSLHSGSGGGEQQQRYRESEMILTRRPRHPVDESRLHSVVTVVVCRFCVPPALVVGHHPLLRTQLKELESLSLAFHTRLRRAAQGRQVSLTECGIAEVVFSINTVLPVQSLVATTTAVALGLAAQKELSDWAPTYRGERVQWGVAVHRFRAVLRSAGVNGRLTLSFGSLEYDVARELAQLAALCNYSVLCHADFFTDAMNEARGLPVDYVMDRMRRLFYVYQLHEEDVPDESKHNMVDALSLMRGGRYSMACRFLETWKRHMDEGTLFPAAAWHLLYVSHFLSEALNHSEGSGLLHDTGDFNVFTTSSSAATAAMAVVPGFPEWAAERLAHAYGRPPPVWEEGHDDAATIAAAALAADATPKCNNLCFSFVRNTVRNGEATGRLPMTVVSTANISAGNFTRWTNSVVATRQANRQSAPSPPVAGSNEASVLRRITPDFRCGHFSTFATPTSIPQTSQEQPGFSRQHVFMEDVLLPSSSSATRGLRSPLTLNSSSFHVESALRSPLSPRSALATRRSVLVTAETPVALPVAIQAAERAHSGVRAPGGTTNAYCGGSNEAQQQQLTAMRPTSPLFNLLSPNAKGAATAVTHAAATRGVVTAINPLALPLPESMRAQRMPAASPNTKLPRAPSILLSPRSILTEEELNEFQAVLSARSGGSRHVRRKNSMGSKRSRSRNRSCSFIFDDESGENEFTPHIAHNVAGFGAAPHPTSPVVVTAPHSVKSPDYLRVATEGVNHLPTSSRSAHSLTLSGFTHNRSVPLSAKLPLFSDDAVTLPGVRDDGERSDTNSTGDADITSFGEVSHERSMTSAMQRSRSMMSTRAAAAPATSVVCTRIRYIAGDASSVTQVFQGFHPHGYLVAIKRVTKNSPKLLQLLRNEIQLLHRLSHPNIVHFIGDWEDATALYMVVDYASDTLTSILMKFRRLLPGVVRHYIRGVLRALAYLHDRKGFVHRDVSPNNIIITNASDSSEAKLIDFGRSIFLSTEARSAAMSSVMTTLLPRASSHGPADCRSAHSTDSTSPQPAPPPPPHQQPLTYSTVVGTPLFMSPQACQGLVHPANDVWSVGVIMYLCLTGEYPYPEEAFVDPETFIASVSSGRLTPTLDALSDTMLKERGFIEQCLRLDYMDRPSAAVLLNHPFIIV